MTLEQTREHRGYKWLFQNLLHWHCGKQRNEPRNEAELLRRFDDHGQLHGRRLHLDCRAGIRIKGAIDDVSPMHQIRYGAGIEAETLLRDHGNETGTRFEIRIIKLAIAVVLLEMGGILRRQKAI